LLADLQAIYLSNNQFSGSIPSELFALPNLLFTGIRVAGNPNVYAVCDEYFDPNKIDIPCTLSPIPNTPFYVDLNVKNWDECASFAGNTPFTFASIRNQQENNDVTDFLWSNGFAGVWLGGYQTSYDDEPAGNWAWLDETTWTNSTYTNWSPGLPDNYYDDAHHLYLQSWDGTWGDGSNEWSLHCLLRDPISSFVSKRAPTTEPTTTFQRTPTTYAVNIETFTSTVLPFLESIVTFFMNFLPFYD